MPPNLDTVYTTSDDLAFLLGQNGLTLRIDDAISSAGGISGATNASPIVVTTPIAHGLSTGAVILIVGVLGNTAANGEWTITVLSSTTFSLDGSSGSGNYTSSGAWYATSTSSTITTAAINVASSKVNMFAQPLYDVADLATSWTVWDWATNIAAHWLCTRRGNPVPNSIQNRYLESLDELAAVKRTELFIPDVGIRNNVMITWSACRLDRRWSIKQLRVERPLSDRTPIKNYSQKTDLNATILGPAEIDSL